MYRWTDGYRRNEHDKIMIKGGKRKGNRRNGTKRDGEERRGTEKRGSRVGTENRDSGKQALDYSACSISQRNPVNRSLARLVALRLYAPLR